MDDVRIGRILRALRRRLGWTQARLASRVGLSQQAISLIERGHGSRLSAATLRRVFGGVDARWEPFVSWRGGELDRLLDEDHARLVGETVRRLTSLGWELAVEVTYSEYGDRGSIDVLGARREASAVCSAEIKSDLTVIEGTVRKTDEKDRVVRRFVCRQRFGFQPRSVGRLLVLPSNEPSRRRVRRSSAVLDVAFPARGSHVRRWLRTPDGDMAGILFLSNTNPGGGTRVQGGHHRVRPARSSARRT